MENKNTGITQYNSIPSGKLRPEIPPAVHHTNLSTTSELFDSAAARSPLSHAQHEPKHSCPLNPQNPATGYEGRKENIEEFRLKKKKREFSKIPEFMQQNGFEDGGVLF